MRLLVFGYGYSAMGFLTRKGSVVDETELQRDIEQQLDAGDHERFAHYVKKEKIVESAVSGKPVTALCGKKWVPTRDPNRFPICPTCKEIHAGLRKGPGENGSNDGAGNSN